MDQETFIHLFENPCSTKLPGLKKWPVRRINAGAHAYFNTAIKIDIKTFYILK